jgi:rare lipoprotein A (peptidoglycan hydrolase)
VIHARLTATLAASIATHTALLFTAAALLPRASLLPPLMVELAAGAPAPEPAAAPVAARATTTTVSPLTPLTTLVEKVLPDAAAASSALTRSDSGVASWFKTGERICAHRTLPMGTEVKVTRTATGASATCTVADRGPAVGTGRLIDLSPDTFDKLADRGAGLIDVTIQW